MPPQPTPPAAATLGIGDIYYILFRHKWKILLCTVASLIAAGVAYKLRKPIYQSDAKLFIRYVLADQQLSPIGTGDTAKSPDHSGETIMSSESEILTSADLAKQVVSAIGAEKILAKIDGGKDPIEAEAVVRKGLMVDVPTRSTVIHITFRHPDAEIVQSVLQHLIDAYRNMHREVHQSLGIAGDFLTQETDQLRGRLTQTEEDLRKAEAKAGIYSSIEEAKKTYADQIATLRLELINAQAELAEQSSALPQHAGVDDKKAPTVEAPLTPAAPSQATIDEYSRLLTRIAALSATENQLLLQFTAENNQVKAVQQLRADVEKRKLELEKAYPQFTARPTSETKTGTPVVASQVDPNEAVRAVSALQAKVKVLNSQLQQLTTEASKIGDMEVTIAELRRRESLDEANYKRFAESLEQSRIDEASGNGRVSNISVIEAPTFPMVDAAKTNKVIGGIAAAGLALGLAWAFGIELYLDRTIKRPIDVERHSRLPLFISLPRLKEARNDSKGGADVAGTGERNLAALATHVPLRAYHETLRDRLITFFESINLTHKPKLVAVTSVGRKAGVTTTAMGLSQSLSEIGEGNVLLVDMSAGQGAAQQFLKGKPVSDLDGVLDSRAGAHVHENLYVVSADSAGEQLSRNLPQRFTKLVPKLKASDFDYIIFDLPPVSQISITPRLAGFMDMVLIVVESEKTDRDLLQRATTLLGKTNVGAVLNRTRNFGPKQLQEEFLCGV